jgi:CRISPR/Cas system-associated protein Cas10 (large subunit of type III CRISPR-Cas system)
MEDSLYDLYSAVQKQNCPRVKVAAADVIVAASKIVECAESLIKVSGRQEKAGPRKGTKKCSRCGFTKIVGEFWPDMSKPDGLRTHCKTCEKSYQRDKRKQRRKRRVTSSSGS